MIMCVELILCILMKITHIKFLFLLLHYFNAVGEFAVLNYRISTGDFRNPFKIFPSVDMVVASPNNNTTGTTWYYNTITTTAQQWYYNISYINLQLVFHITIVIFNYIISFLYLYVISFISIFFNVKVNDRLLLF